jgi:uncharacterized membrane protein YedE/YeeE
MRFISFLGIGILFGIVLYKSEAASWFRIYEMFQLGSFHMYGIISSAVILGVAGLYLIKKKEIKALNGAAINPTPKEFSVTRYLVGGIFFGLGWALVGACPGPMYVLIGAGYWPILIVIVGALLGTLLYGVLRTKLPY